VRDAAPLTIAALVLLAGPSAIVPARPSDLQGGVGLYLALIAALTLPHTLLVTWLDWRQGVWRTPR
jgi:beta-carotene 15,15'-dioxygenase